MTIATAKNTPRNTYTATGGQTVFTIGFEFFATGDIKVFRNGTALTYNAAPSSVAQFSVQGTTNASDSAYEFGAGGTVTLGAGATADDSIVIVRDIVVERTTDFTPAASFDVTALNTQLDTLMAMMAEREEGNSRSIRLPLSETTTVFDMELPAQATRANKVLEFDSNGDPQCLVTSTNIATLGNLTSELSTLAAISSDITTVSGVSANVTTVAGISANVTTVAGVSSNVTTVAGISADVTSVAGDATDIGKVAAIDSDVTSVANIDSNVTTVAGISANVTTVAGDSADITALAAKTTELGLLGTADVIADMNTLAVSAIITDMDALADLNTELDALGDVTADITTVAGISANVTTVAGISANTTTVAGIASDVTAVAGISSAVSAVNSNETNINAVNSNSSNINIVAGNSTNINTVAGNNTNINTVAGIDSNITTVAGISANVTSVAGVSSDVTSVAGITSDVTTVAGVSSNVTTVATNIAGVNSFAERYRVGSSDPATSLDEGDLFYNSTENAVKYYNGSAWASIVPGIANIVEDTTPQLGGNLDTQSFTVDGRDVSTDGTKLDTIETNADVTDAANVTSAGALMDSECTSLADVKALNQSVTSSASPTFVTLNATTVDLGNWTITESSGVLYFATSGTNKMKLDASGNLTVVGDITAYGTV